jgi:hypothetical protein
MAREASDVSTSFSPGAVPGRGGFSARFQGASLWDLVQMECLARSRAAVRIQSASGQSGLMFFDSGRIVHAQTARAIGELAAMEILAWESGSFDTCDAAWPRTLTITTSAEGLLLLAAKSRDDSGASNLVAFPARATGSAGSTPVIDMAAEAASSEEAEAYLLVDDQDWEMEVTIPGSNNEPPARQPTPPRRATGEEVGFPVEVLVAADGTILEAADDDLADAVAYAGRLSSLIGELLGLDGFRALECASKEERLIMYTGRDGGLVAGRLPAGTEVAAVRDWLGL